MITVAERRGKLMWPLDNNIFATYISNPNLEASTPIVIPIAMLLSKPRTQWRKSLYYYILLGLSSQSSQLRTPQEDFLEAKQSITRSLTHADVKELTKTIKQLSEITHTFEESIDKSIKTYRKLFLDLTQVLNNLITKIDVLNKTISKLELKTIAERDLSLSASVPKDLSKFIEKSSLEFILRKAYHNKFLFPILHEVIIALDQILTELKGKGKVTKWDYTISYNPAGIDWERIIIWIHGDFNFSSADEKEDFEDVVIERKIEEVIKSFKARNKEHIKEIDEVNALLTVFLSDK